MSFFLPTEGVPGSSPTLGKRSPVADDVSAHIARETAKFRTMSKNIPQPLSLAGVSNYMEWREEIELAARTAGILEILQNPATRPSSRDHVQLWNECNMWLYCFIWDSISDGVKMHIYKGFDKDYSAYGLWKKVEEALVEKPEVARRRLIKELCEIDNQRSGGDRLFVLKIIKIRAQLKRIKFPLPDYFFHDLLLNSVSHAFRGQLEARLKGPLVFSAEMDFEQFLNEVLRQLPIDFSH